MAGLGDMFGQSMATVNGQKPRNSDRIQQATNPIGQAYEAASGVVKQGYNNAKAGLSDPKVLASYVRKGFNIDAITKASDWRMAGLDAMTGSSDMPRDVQRAGVDAAMNIALNAPAQTVWHGSPHKFDKFDMSKIGTGEGAQAYGHGLYMAEAKETADTYAKNLGDFEMRVDGNPFNADDISHQAALDVFGMKGDKWATVKALQRDAQDLIARDKEWTQKAGKEKAARAEWIATHDSIPKYEEKSLGQLYKSDIPDEAIVRFLDWDKPLNQQAPEVRQAIAPWVREYGLPMDESGKSLYSVVKELEATKNGAGSGSGAAEFNKMAPLASEQLAKAGIPGIRYLDGGSRGAGEGSSNFVLFDDKLPRILEVNGQATGAKPWGAGEWQSAIGAAFGGK